MSKTRLQLYITFIPIREKRLYYLSITVLKIYICRNWAVLFTTATSLRTIYPNYFGIFFCIVCHYVGVLVDPWIKKSKFGIYISIKKVNSLSI